MKDYVVAIVGALVIFGGGVALGTQLDFGENRQKQAPERQTPEPTEPATTPVGPGEQLGGRVLAGDTRTGTVLFLVSNNAVPEELRFEPVTGGGAVGRWRVP